MTPLLRVRGTLAEPKTNKSINNTTRTADRNYARTEYEYEYEYEYRKGCDPGTESTVQHDVSVGFPFSAI